MNELIEPALTAIAAFAGAWLAHRFALRQAEHGTRFQRQYERRDEVIGKTWQLLLEASNGFHNWASPFGRDGEPSKVEQGKDVYDAIREFVIYYRSHMLWFDQPTLDRLNRFTDEMLKGFHNLYDAFEKEQDGQDVWAERVEARREVWQWTREGLPEWIRNIEGDFRRALGEETRPWWRRTWRLRRDKDAPGA